MVERPLVLGDPDQAAAELGDQRLGERGVSRLVGGDAEGAARAAGGEVDVGAGEGHRGVQREHVRRRRRRPAAAPRGRAGRRCARRTGPAPDRAGRGQHRDDVGEHVVGDGEQQQVAGAADRGRLVERDARGAASSMRAREASDSPAAATTRGRRRGARRRGRRRRGRRRRPRLRVTGRVMVIAFRSSPARRVPDGVLMRAQRTRGAPAPSPAPGVGSVTAPPRRTAVPGSRSLARLTSLACPALPPPHDGPAWKQRLGPRAVRTGGVLPPERPGRPLPHLGARAPSLLAEALVRLLRERGLDTVVDIGAGRGELLSRCTRSTPT